MTIAGAEITVTVKERGAMTIASSVPGAVTVKTRVTTITSVAGAVKAHDHHMSSNTNPSKKCHDHCS
jgi:hypothetical protein